MLPNSALKTRAEWQQATQQGKALGLPLHRADEKNWDHLAAVNAIVSNVPKSGSVLDAGSEFYSNVLPALFVYGFRDLCGMNLAFTDKARRGPIQYLPGDITRTGFPDASFDAITCMSVIEHGVPLELYFKEMFRVLKPDGILITSTDYYPEPVDTRMQTAYGAPITIYSREQAKAVVALALGTGFQTTGEIDFECTERPVRWENYGLEFSFLIFTLRKP